MRTLLFLFLLITTQLGAQTGIQAGPMVGYSTMQEVQLWVQTTGPGTVQIEYFDSETPTVTARTAPHLTTKADAYTAKLLADEVEPGRRYGYRVLLDGQAQRFTYPLEFQTQALWQYRNDPPPFKVAVGSCFYVNEPRYDRPGKGYGGENKIFTAIDAARPDAMIWLGDNTYLREPDWHSQTGIFHRYTHSRSVPELQPLLARTHHYATWDDHDYGPNDADGSWYMKDVTRRAFELFWANKTTGVPRVPDGITTMMQWNDVHFFMLDNRYFRTPNDCQSCDPVLLGKAQIDWLVEALVESKASFKLVCVGGQVLNTAKKWETYNNLAPAERAYLLGRIEAEEIKNVVFVNGDRHHSELSSYRNAAGYTVHDLTASPLTAGVGRPQEEVNRLRVPGTLVVERNFGLLEFSGPRKARVLTVGIYDNSGKQLWERTIEQE